MAVETKEVYSSPNGDRWFLGRDAATGRCSLGTSPTPRQEAGQAISRSARF